MSEHKYLILLCTVVAFSSAAVMLALDTVGLVHLASDAGASSAESAPPLLPAGSIVTGSIAPQPLPALQPDAKGSVVLPAAPGLQITGEGNDRELARLSYVPQQQLPLRMPHYEDAPADGFDAGDAATWSADVKPTVTARAAVPVLPPVIVQNNQPQRVAALAPTTLAPTIAPHVPWLTTAPGSLRRDKRLTARLTQIAPAASVRLAQKFAEAKASWPPANVALVGIKDEKALELYARPAGGAWQFVHRYKVLAASGRAGPKLVQGDKQVPEGIYGISFLNPDSRYHVSLRVNFPNAFDRQMAAQDGRKNLGGDIMIHGKNASAGCLAVGDEAAEEMFVLAAQVGLANVKVVIAPTDLRTAAAPQAAPGQPAWLPKLYSDLTLAMADFKKPPPASGLQNLLSLFKP